MGSDGRMTGVRCTMVFGTGHQCRSSSVRFWRAWSTDAVYSSFEARCNLHSPNPCFPTWEELSFDEWTVLSVMES